MQKNRKTQIISTKLLLTICVLINSHALASSQALYPIFVGKDLTEKSTGKITLGEVVNRAVKLSLPTSKNHVFANLLSNEFTASLGAPSVNQARFCKASVIKSASTPTVAVTALSDGKNTYIPQLPVNKVPGGVLLGLVYSDKPISIKGVMDCEFPTLSGKTKTKYIYDIKLKQGWNKYYYVDKGENIKYSVYDGPITWSLTSQNFYPKPEDK